MIANVVDNRWIYLEHITDPEDQVLWEAFSVCKPNSYIDPNARGNWDGVYRKYNRAKKRLVRPLLNMLRSVCSKHNLPLAVRDTRDKWEYQTLNPDDITPDFLPGIKLESYQIRAIQQCCKAECGIIDMPTGSGKGEIICGICKAIQCPTLILADQRVVVDQLKKRLELRDVADEVGLFYAGKRPNGQMIVVGLIQSLNPPRKMRDIPKRNHDESDSSYNKRLNKWEQSYKAYKTRLKNVKFLYSYVKKAQMIIVDECDKATSESYKSLFRNYYNGRRRYGFSATAFDPDKPVEALVMQEHLGSVIVKESRKTVLQLNRIVDCKCKVLPVGLDGNIYDASTYDLAYSEWLINNDKFHQLIISICRKYINDGTLILVDRQELGHALRKALVDCGIESYFIYGKTPKKRRDEILRRFEKRDFNVLIGGKIINRGLDLSGGCENLIIASGGKLQSELLQKIGRAFRKNQQGHSRIFSFYFRCNRYLYDHSKRQLKAMVNSGFDVKVILPGGIIDGRELVEDRKFRIERKFYHKQSG